MPGNELVTIKRILTYIHDKIRHDGQNGNPKGGNNSINFAEACKDGSRGLNCRGLATVLNECYLSMGIPSRVITCMPKTYINDCHVINAVYSSTLGKWLWIDPTNDAWVTDELGNLLSVQEVRARLRNGQPVQVNEEANWNNEKKTTTEDYLYEYMAKICSTWKAGHAMGSTRKAIGRSSSTTSSCNLLAATARNGTRGTIPSTTTDTSGRLLNKRKLIDENAEGKTTNNVDRETGITI